jgi:hypothetical protein
MTNSRRWRCVAIESPFADVARNLSYLRAAMRDCIFRGEAPFASHGLYTQWGVLDDDKPIERELGITAGFAWGERADAVVVYTDLGISSGMERGIARAEANGCPVEYRELGEGWSAPKIVAPFSIGDIVLVSGETPFFRVLQVVLDGDPQGFRLQLEPVGVEGALLVIPAWRCRRVPRPEVR